MIEQISSLLGVVYKDPLVFAWACFWLAWVFGSMRLFSVNISTETSNK